MAWTEKDGLLCCFLEILTQQIILNQCNVISFCSSVYVYHRYAFISLQKISLFCSLVRLLLSQGNLNCFLVNNKERLVLPDDWPPNAFDKAYSCYSWLGAAKWRLAIVLGACYKTLSISWLLVMLHWRPYFDLKDLEN